MSSPVSPKVDPVLSTSGAASWLRLRRRAASAFRCAASRPACRAGVLWRHRRQHARAAGGSDRRARRPTSRSPHPGLWAAGQPSSAALLTGTQCPHCSHCRGGHLLDGWRPAPAQCGASGHAGTRAHTSGEAGQGVGRARAHTLHSGQALLGAAPVLLCRPLGSRVLPEDAVMVASRALRLQQRRSPDHGAQRCRQHELFV